MHVFVAHGFLAEHDEGQAIKTRLVIMVTRGLEVPCALQLAWSSFRCDIRAGLT